MSDEAWIGLWVGLLPFILAIWLWSIWAALDLVRDLVDWLTDHE
jgi:hypothetical protein